MYMVLLSTVNNHRRNRYWFQRRQATWSAEIRKRISIGPSIKSGLIYLELTVKQLVSNSTLNIGTKYFVQALLLIFLPTYVLISVIMVHISLGLLSIKLSFDSKHTTLHFGIFPNAGCLKRNVIWTITMCLISVRFHSPFSHYLSGVTPVGIKVAKLLKVDFW